MSFRFGIQVQPSGRLVIAVFEGEMSVESERQALAAHAREPGIDLMADLLVDRRRAVSVGSSREFDERLRQARAVFPSGQRRPRMAVIVGSDAEFGKARMFEQRGAERMPHEVKVVRSVEEACDWLGVRPEDLVWPQRPESGPAPS